MHLYRRRLAKNCHFRYWYLITIGVGWKYLGTCNDAQMFVLFLVKITDAIGQSNWLLYGLQPNWGEHGSTSSWRIFMKSKSHSKNLAWSIPRHLVPVPKAITTKYKSFEFKLSGIFSCERVKLYAGSCNFQPSASDLWIPWLLIGYMGRPHSMSLVWRANMSCMVMWTVQEMINLPTMRAILRWRERWGWAS